MLLLKRKYHSKQGSVKTMIVLGSGRVLGLISLFSIWLCSPAPRPPQHENITSLQGLVVVNG